MRVEKRLLYHVNSQANRSPYGLMRGGDVVAVGKDTNPFFRFYDVHQRTYPVTDGNGIVHQVPAVKFLRLVKEGGVNARNLPGDAFEIAQHFMMLARELLWEGVRLAEFADAPSRQRCVWLIESLEDVKRWLRLMKFRPVHVVQVAATGNALVTDQGHLAGDSEILQVWFDRARAYWRGERTAESLMEVLFEGTLEVTDIVDPSAYQDASAAT